MSKFLHMQQVLLSIHQSINVQAKENKMRNDSRNPHQKIVQSIEDAKTKLNRKRGRDTYKCTLASTVPISADRKPRENTHHFGGKLQRFPTKGVL